MVTPEGSNVSTTIFMSQIGRGFGWCDKIIYRNSILGVRQRNRNDLRTKRHEGIDGLTYSPLDFGLDAFNKIFMRNTHAQTCE